jgi:hypothetical protein
VSNRMHSDASRLAGGLQRNRADCVPIRCHPPIRGAAAHSVRPMRIRLRRRWKLAVAMLALLGLSTLIAIFAFAIALVDLAQAAWRPPVQSAAVTRGFDPGRPFEPNRHRGVDLAAAPGTPVRAPCGGPVAFAGQVGTSGLVVTLLCGRWRVTHMPLASIAVEGGVRVNEGARLGTVAASREHRGLHLGVRRDGTRFGYADPLRFLSPAGPSSPPPLGPAPRPRRPRPRTTRRQPPARPVVAPRPIVAPRPVVAPRRVVAPRHTGPRSPGSNPGVGGPVAPWPVWLGLAPVLAGVGVRWRGRGRTDARWLPGGQRQPVR